MAINEKNVIIIENLIKMVETESKKVQFLTKTILAEISESSFKNHTLEKLIKLLDKQVDNVCIAVEDLSKEALD